MAKNKLGKEQREYLLTLIADGLQTDEINKKTKAFADPFTVTRQAVDFYRSSRGVRLDELKEESESESLRTGLALREGRVETLKELGERLRRELLSADEDGRLWLRRKKALGTGAFMEVVEVEELNVAGIRALRDVLDDIAKEMHARIYQRRDELPEENPLDDEDLDELSDEELQAIAEGRA